MVMLQQPDAHPMLSLVLVLSPPYCSSPPLANFEVYVGIAAQRNVLAACS
jgi:hypothetical protein